MPPKGCSPNKKNPKVAPSKDVKRDQVIENSLTPTVKVQCSQRPKKPTVKSEPKEVHIAKPVKKVLKKGLKPMSPEPDNVSVTKSGEVEEAESEEEEGEDKRDAEDKDKDKEEEQAEEDEEEEEAEEKEVEEDNSGTLTGASEDEGLAEGDTIYQEPLVPEKVQLAKRPAPDTPPLDTRASKCLSGAQKTPMKKRRHHSLLSSNTEISTPSKKSEVKKEEGKEEKGKGKEKETPIKKSPSKQAPVVKKGRKKAKVEYVDSDKEIDFKKLSELDEDNGEVFLQDLTILRVKILPEVCEVTSPNDQDPLLKKVGAYKNLPHLGFVHVEPLRQSPKVGLVNWSKWSGLIKDFPEPMARHAIVFAKEDHYVNFAHVDPCRLTAHKLWGNSWLEIRTLFNRPVIVLTPIMIVDSFVKAMNTTLAYSGNYFTGIMHAQEWARFISRIGMITKNNILHMQIWADAITFGTKGQPSSLTNSLTNGTGHNNLPDVPGLFNVNASPSKRAGGPDMKFKDIAPLEYGHAIPVYDAHGVEFDYNAEVFSEMDKNFKEYKGEIPRASHVVAAHITQVHKYNDQFHIVLYPVWALLIGTP